jgi:hypothetical protein
MQIDAQGWGRVIGTAIVAHRCSRMVNKVGELGLLNAE